MNNQGEERRGVSAYCQNCEQYKFLAFDGPAVCDDCRFEKGDDWFWQRLEQASSDYDDLPEWMKRP